MTEKLSLSEFEEQLRHVARYDRSETLIEPLGMAVRTIRENPALPGSRLLLRLLHALAGQNGEFRRAETAVFDPVTRRLVIELMNSAHSGIISAAAWTAAASEGDAASLA
jgi:hypothetical protein